MPCHAVASRICMPSAILVDLVYERFVRPLPFSPTVASCRIEGSHERVTLTGLKVLSETCAPRDDGGDMGRLDDRQGRRPRLSDELGGRLALTLASVPPVQKPSRPALIRMSVSEMCDEVVYDRFARMARAFEPRQQHAERAVHAVGAVIETHVST